MGRGSSDDAERAGVLSGRPFGAAATWTRNVVRGRGTVHVDAVSAALQSEVREAVENVRVPALGPSPPSRIYETPI